MADDTAFKFTAPSYWRLLQDSRHKIIKAPFEYNGKSMGNYELYLLTGDDVVEKKVLEMRQAGMKIREDCAFRIPMNFTAIFIATGEGAASQDPRACLKIKNCTKHVFLSPFHDRIKKKGAFICQDVMN